MSPKSKRKKPSPRAKKRTGGGNGRRPRKGGIGAGVAETSIVEGWKPADAPEPVSPKPFKPKETRTGKVSTVASKVFPQWLRTAIMVFVWLASLPLYVSVIAPYSAYLSAAFMGFCLAIFSGVAPHVWPSRTPPWRTVFWAFIGSIAVSMPLLTTGTGRLATVIATIVGFAIVILRAGQNGRRLVGLVQDWRTLR